MPDLVLRAKVAVYLQLQPLEPFNDPEQFGVVLVPTQNQLSAQIDHLCARIEHERRELIAAMHLENPQQKLHTIRGILNRYDTNCKKILMDEPTHNVLILALNGKHSSKEIVEFLLNVYKEIDPKHILIKDAFDCYPEVLEFAIPLACTETIHLLLNLCRDIGYLEKTLLHARYAVFLQATKAHPDIFKAIVSAYREIDPSSATLKNALATNHAKVFSTIPEQNQNSNNTSKAMLIALYREYSNSLLGGFAIFGWSYAFNSHIRQQMQSIFHPTLIRNSISVRDDQTTIEFPTQPRTTAHHLN
jgi:hypothetical protein